MTAPSFWFSKRALSLYCFLVLHCAAIVNFANFKKDYLLQARGRPTLFKNDVMSQQRPVDQGSLQNRSEAQLSHCTKIHAQIRAVSDTGCITRCPSVRVLYCPHCRQSEYPIDVFVNQNLRCLVLTDVACVEDSMIDGVLWNFVNFPKPEQQNFGKPERNATNRNQIWFAESIETDAPPYWLRPIGATSWMSSMNYARHYGANTDFPVDNVAGLATWAKTESSVLDAKTHSIIYMSSNCVTQSERDDFVQRASLFMDITSVGSCVKNSDIPLRLKHLEEDSGGNSRRGSWKNYTIGAHALLLPYRFRLLIISTICDDYWAEKVNQTLAAGVIPIYLGMPNSHDWDPGLVAGVHPAMIHVQDFDGLSELSQFIQSLGADTDEARLRRRRYLEYQDAPPAMFPRHAHEQLEKTGGLKWTEFICQRLYDGDSKRRIDVQRPCAGPWWKFLESMGKDLTRWGCTDEWPCNRV